MCIFKKKKPSHEIDEYLFELRKQLADVRKTTDEFVLAETRAKNALAACDKQIEELQYYAEQAVAAGDDQDARSFLEERSKYVMRRPDLVSKCESTSAQADSMKNMHDQLVDKILNLEARKSSIMATMAQAEAQAVINGVTNKKGRRAKKAAMTMEELAEEADRKQREAEAMASLNQSAYASDLEQLQHKYDEPAQPVSIDDELAAIKNKNTNH